MADLDCHMFNGGQWCEQRGNVLPSSILHHLWQMWDLTLRSGELVSWPSIWLPTALRKTDPIRDLCSSVELTLLVIVQCRWDKPMCRSVGELPPLLVCMQCVWGRDALTLAPCRSWSIVAFKSAGLMLSPVHNSSATLAGGNTCEPALSSWEWESLPWSYGLCCDGDGDAQALPPVVDENVDPALARCRTREKRSYTLPGRQSRAEPVDGGMDEQVPRKWRWETETHPSSNIWRHGQG